MMADSMGRDNPLAQEITAQIQLGLFGTAGKLARQLRMVDRIAPLLREGGVVRRIAVDRDRARRSLGVAAAGRMVGAFGGLLYAAGALAHEAFTEGATIVRTASDSRLDVGDMTYLEADRRLDWKRYELVYSLLADLFGSGGELPRVIILDLPLVMGRAVYAQSLEEDQQDRELRREVGALREQVESFWHAYRDRCFPFDAHGPYVVSLGRRRFGSLLRLIASTGRGVSPDPIDPKVEQLLQGDWAEVLSISTERLLTGVLTDSQRTAAFDYDLGNLDQSAFPRALIEQGMVGFHYLAGLRGRPIQVETIGSAEHWHRQGGQAALDDLAGMLVALTYFDHPKALPLPLWYAQEGVKVIKERGLLEFYKRETLRAMRDEQVEQTWLASWDAE